MVNIELLDLIIKHLGPYFMLLRIIPKKFPLEMGAILPEVVIITFTQFLAGLDVIFILDFIDITIYFFE